MKTRNVSTGRGSNWAALLLTFCLVQAAQSDSGKVSGAATLAHRPMVVAAANPLEAMGTHEASILAGTGGTSASSSIPDDIAAAIKKNTDLFNSMGVESVPYIVAKNAATGQVVTNAGAMETAALVQFLGIN